ncbi:MAG TPA: hypothetical protein VNH82_09185 [Candidatus Dormibacteraeota bacterium]|nr:hypothetical protein [Candidatus Dormibacteraeota bacterium]
MPDQRSSGPTRLLFKGRGAIAAWALLALDVVGKVTAAVIVATNLPEWLRGAWWVLFKSPWGDVLVPVLLIVALWFYARNGLAAIRKDFESKSGSAARVETLATIGIVTSRKTGVIDAFASNKVSRLPLGDGPVESVRFIDPDSGEYFTPPRTIKIPESLLESLRRHLYGRERPCIDVIRIDGHDLEVEGHHLEGAPRAIKLKVLRRK